VSAAIVGLSSSTSAIITHKACDNLQQLNIDCVDSRLTAHPLGLQVDFGVDLDSRVALVGPNGAGKSTLLKLMVGTLEPLDGMVKRHNHLKIGQYHQHLTELLDPELTPLEYMVSHTTPS